MDTLSVLTGSPAGSGWEAILAISTEIAPPPEFSPVKFIDLKICVEIHK